MCNIFLILGLMKTRKRMDMMKTRRRIEMTLNDYCVTSAFHVKILILMLSILWHLRLRLCVSAVFL